jgi:hypothetical protein
MKKTMTKDAVDSFFTHLKKSIIISQGDTVKQATQIAKSADNALTKQQATLETLAATIETLAKKIESLEAGKAPVQAQAPVIQKSVVVSAEAHPYNQQAQAQVEDAPALINKAFDLLKSTNDKARQHDLSRAISLLNIGGNPAEIKKNFNL